MMTAVAASRGQFFLPFARDCVGFAVLGRIVAGLLPQLLALYEQLPGLGWVDLVRTQRSLGQDGDALRKHLDKSPGNEENLAVAVAAVQPHLAGSEFGQQRRGAVERLQVARTRRQLHRLRGSVQQQPVRADQPHRQQSRTCTRFCHLAFAFANNRRLTTNNRTYACSIFSDAASTSSMPPL